MAKININGKEYEVEKLPKEAIELINSIKFVDSEIQKLQNQAKVLMAAKMFYMQRIQSIVSKLEKKPSEEKISFEQE